MARYFGNVPQLVKGMEETSDRDPFSTWAGFNYLGGSSSLAECVDRFLDPQPNATYLTQRYF